MGRKKGGMQLLSSKTPKEVFDMFDKDGSGAISFDEFKVMLTELGINLTVPKALLYFKRCDTDGSGEIDFSEFEMVLYAINPVTGNSMGFSPAAFLGPFDTFQMFDKDGSGLIDEDEFGLLVDYMGYRISEPELEALFKKYDDDGSGEISYKEFKQMWLNLCDVRLELARRGVDAPLLMPRSYLEKRLDVIISREEEAEARAMEEAAAWRRWKHVQALKKADADHVKRTANALLASALDAAGQVYFFGHGKDDCFIGEPTVDTIVEHSRAIQKLWVTRVRPVKPEMDAKLEEMLIDERNAIRRADELDAEGFYPPNTQRLRPRSEAKNRGITVRSFRMLPKAPAPLTTMLQRQAQQLKELEEQERLRQGNNAGSPQSSRSRASGSVKRSARSQASDEKDSDDAGSELSSARSGQTTDRSDASGASGGSQKRSRTRKPRPKAIQEVEEEEDEEEESEGSESSSDEDDAARNPMEWSMKAKPAIITDLRVGLARRRFIEYSAFHALDAATNTYPLWGHGTLEARLGASVAMARTSEGELFVWGGRQKWWTGGVYNELDPTANDHIVGYSVPPPPKRVIPEKKRHGLGDLQQSMSVPLLTAAAQAALPKFPEELPMVDVSKAIEPVKSAPVVVTPRSAMLLTTAASGQWVGKQIADLSREEEMTAAKADDAEADAIKLVATYFKQWVPPPHAKTRMEHVRKVILPRIPADELNWAMELRGDVNALRDCRTKAEQVQRFAEALEVEKRALTQDVQEELQIRARAYQEALRAKNMVEAKKIAVVVKQIWQELLPTLHELRARRQDRKQAIARHKQYELDQSYKIFSQQRAWVLAHRDHPFLRPEPEKTPRGLHGHIHLGSMTQRGPPMHFARGVERIMGLAVGTHHAAAIHRRVGLYTWGCGANGRLGHGSYDDEQRPRVVEALENAAIVSVACGRTHTAAIVAGGDLYIWGLAALGQLGLDTSGARLHITEVGHHMRVEADSDFKGVSFLPYPTRLVLPMDRRVVMVSCGKAHTAAISEDGKLFVWGCADSGRLGLGFNTPAVVPFPTMVKSLADYFITHVSCGWTHSACVSRITMTPPDAVVHERPFPQGGYVFVTGSRWALGHDIFAFEKLEGLEKVHAVSVSCGRRHTAFITMEGELWSWGQNTHGCTGHPVSERAIPAPRRVECLYHRPHLLSTHGVATQSSVYNQLEAQIALSGNTLGLREDTCSHTLYDYHAWWEVDLGEKATIAKIVVHNRQNFGGILSHEPPDKYSRRLFPFYILVSVAPFPTGPASHGPQGLEMSLAVAAEYKRCDEHLREITWHLPASVVGRYVRIQLERRNFLHLAQVEVFGEWHDVSVPRPVMQVDCGDEVTAVVIQPETDRDNLERFYRKAIAADSQNAYFLRELPAYHDFYEMYGLDYRRERRTLEDMMQYLELDAEHAADATVETVIDDDKLIAKLVPAVVDNGARLTADELVELAYKYAVSPRQLPPPPPPDPHPAPVLGPVPEPPPVTFTIVESYRAYFIQDVLEVTDCSWDPSLNECPLCIPFLPCATCAYHNKWIGRYFQRRHGQILKSIDDAIKERSMVFVRFAAQVITAGLACDLLTKPEQPRIEDLVQVIPPKMDIMNEAFNLRMRSLDDTLELAISCELAPRLSKVEEVKNQGVLAKLKATANKVAHTLKLKSTAAARAAKRRQQAARAARVALADEEQDEDGNSVASGQPDAPALDGPVRSARSGKSSVASIPRVPIRESMLAEDEEET